MIPKSLRAIGYYFRGMTGVAPGTVYEIVRAWDHDEAGFRAVAAEWLETRTSSPSSPSAAPLGHRQQPEAPEHRRVAAELPVFSAR
jgi:hypothetical protein